MTRLGKRASAALCLAGFAATILAVSAASARTERFRWTQSSSVTVTAFTVYWGTSSGSYSSSLAAGLPPKDSTGAYYYDLVVPDSQTIFVTVSALNGSLESPKSNEISRAGIGSTPPPSSPPPPSSSGAAVLGFALWNAQTDTVVDSEFQNGETIPDSIRSCAVIEIKANAYLNAGGAGSIKKVFDGADHGCTGSAYESGPPYGWEDGDGTSWQCSASLSTVGNHTLTVTPYDGENCTGIAGTPVTVNFTVSGPSGGTTTLGAPGQPYIVQ
jgi:hypothetical protein